MDIPLIRKNIEDLGLFRPAVRNDLVSIIKLVKDETDYYFGPVDFDLLLECSVRPMIIMDSQKNMAGFICFQYWPNIRSLLPECWLDWMRYHYEINDVTYGNTIFIKYMAFNYVGDPNMFRSTLKDIFLKYPKVLYICAVAPPVRKDQGVFDDLLNMYGKRYDPKRCEQMTNSQHIYMLTRENFLSQIKLRKALAGDNDILVEILDEKYPELRRDYGDYYIAEAVDKGELIILMEENNRQFGLLWLNKNDDFGDLLKSFELSPFAYLKRKSSVITTNELVINEIVKKDSEEFFESISKIEQNLVGHLSMNADKFSFERRILSRISTETESQSDNPWTTFLTTINLDWHFFQHKFLDQDQYYEIKKTNTYPKISNLSNVFVIDYYGIEKVNEERIFELLQVCFSVSYERDYCLLKVKTNESLKHNLLKYFTRLIPKSHDDQLESHYITHKNILLDELEIRSITKCDVVFINQWLEGNNNKNPCTSECIEIMADTLSNPFSQFSSILVKSNSSIIGLILLKTELRLDLLLKHYEFQSFTNYNAINDPKLHGRILYFYIHPLFESESTFIFSQISRISGFKFFYYSIKRHNECLNLYNNFLTEMYPVLPYFTYRIHDKEDFSNIEVEEEAFEKLETTSFYFQSLQLCQDPRKNVDCRIVSFGFDKTCKGFLKKLLFSPEYRNYRFLNLSVILQHGTIEADSTGFFDKQIVRNSRTWREHYGSEYLNKLGFRVWVNFIGGTMKDIDREKKVVSLQDGREVKYDYLLLLCSTDFGLPIEGNEDGPCPYNFLLHNNNLDGILIFNKLNILKSIFPSGFDIVIYGNSLETYATIKVLLDYEIDGNCIHFVLQANVPKDEVGVGFPDVFITNHILDILREKNVHIYPNYRFRLWYTEVDVNLIKSVVFENKTDIITLQCAVFFCFNRKTVLKTHRECFQRAGLALDGRLVIDDKFQLNDPYIFSAGPMTQYRRLLYANKYDHVHYCPFEAGEVLCGKFLSAILPTVSDTKKDSELKIPILSNPIVIQIHLPGNYLFVFVTRPGPWTKADTAYLLANYGTNLFTGNVHQPNVKNKRQFEFIDNEINANHNNEYFRILLDNDGYVKKIVCLTKRTDRNLEYLSRICFFNETFLNNLKHNYDSGKIKDFLEFFRGKWMALLMSGKFIRFQEENQSFIINSVIKEERMSMPDSELMLKALEKPELQRKLKIELEKNLIHFINKNHTEFFMYHKCDIAPYLNEQD